MADVNSEEIRARLLAAHERAWWRGLTHLVDRTDEQLVVIGPRGDATADDLRDIARAIETWQADFPQARHIWGLSDLLSGQTPRTPPIYITAPFPVDQFEECYEPVALVYVARGTNHEAAARALFERLGELHSKLAWFDDPTTYSHYQR